MDSLLERADELLYKAKRDGRDCVRASLGSEAESSANYVS